MRVLLLADKARDDQPLLFGNLAAAIQQAGDTAVLSFTHVDANDAQVCYDAVVCWGWRRAKWYYDKGMNVLIAERGYLGDRFKWYSLGWNGLNGRAQFATGDASRWERYWGNGHMKQWKSRADAGYALVMGQVPTDTAVRGIKYLSWARDAIDVMRQRGYKTHYRPHPRAPVSLPVGTQAFTGDLSAALAGAAVAVTYNSNSGVDAVLAGVPTIACDEGSMAYGVSAHGLNDPITGPQREVWAHRLAWAQWLIEETALPATWLKLKSVITK